MNQFIVALFFLFLAPNLWACEGAEFRAFDFWLGSWVVYNTDGSVAGKNTIERKQNGCVLHEQYSTAKGYQGESFNSFDRTRNVWHQTWVDNQGTLLLLEGGLKDGAMVLEGDTISATKQIVRNRIIWTPNADGSVRQHWQIKSNEGEWSTAFDGLYKKP